MDVVVDGIVVVQQRKDPLNGAENLQTMNYVMAGVGGVLGTLLAGFFL